MQAYVTEIVNKTKRVVRCFDDGRTVLKVQPGEKADLESNVPTTIYAPYSKLVFKENGEVDCTPNKSWAFPYPDALCMECVVEDGNIEQGFYLSPGHLVSVPPRIPIFVPVSVESSWAFVKKLTYHKVVGKTKDGDFIFDEVKFVWSKEPRSDKEMAEIEEQRLGIAALRAKQEEDARHLKNTTETDA